MSGTRPGSRAYSASDALRVATHDGKNDNQAEFGNHEKIQPTFANEADQKKSGDRQQPLACGQDNAVSKGNSARAESACRHDPLKTKPYACHVVSASCALSFW